MGQDLVEYALVLPLFLLLIISVLEFGLLFFQYTMVANAAREGARAGVVMESVACPSACLTTRINSAARAVTAGIEQSHLTVTTTWLSSATPAPQVRVTVRYSTHFLTKMLIEAVGGKGSVTLQSTSTMQREY